MNDFLSYVTIILFFALAGLAWRYYRLRRHLENYRRSLQSAINAGSPLSGLSVDVPDLEGLSNAVKGLADAHNVQLATVKVEHAKLNSILEQMTDGVLIADAQGWVTYLNPAAERMFETLAGPKRRVTEVLGQYELMEAWKHCQKTREAQSKTVELRARRQFVQLVVLPDRHTGGVLLLAQDLTMVRRLETVRRDFITNVSHELRTPLASLKALTETLRDGALEDTRAAPRFLDRIEIEVDALTQLVQELLDLSRIESGQSPLKLADVHPFRLLQSSAGRMRAQTERAGLVLAVEVPQDLPAVRADFARLEQVLVNLIHNASKFTHPGGKVTLSARVAGMFVRFSVLDTGVGIPREDMARIFERFYKADRARSGGGTGLGLSITSHIIEAHGGNIWVESVEGKGSTFYFTIPISA